MKTRIIAAVALLPLLLIVVIVLPAIYTAILMAALCAIGAYELLYNTGYVKHPRLLAYTMLFAALVSFWCYAGRPYDWGLAGLMVFCCALFGELLWSKAKLPFSKILVCIVGGLIIPFLLCSIVRIRRFYLGHIFVLLPFIIAFSADTGAYFAGKFLGKHPLAPSISPKKTVEGFFGGIASGVLGVIIFSLVLLLGYDLKVNFFYGIVYGIVGSLISVMGDLTFSVIKRQVGLKDYGNLIPGHGGVLDRFDSACLVAPATEALMLIIPLAEVSVWSIL